MNRESREQNVNFPQQFGKYQLVDRLAIGGMAEIYKAKTTGIGGFEKVLVIKKLHDRLSKDDEFIEMMVDEAKIAVRLNHPNIAKIFDLGRVQSQYYIAMEYIDGPDVSRVLEAVDPTNQLLPVPAVLFIGAECCSGLHYAHTRRDAEGRPMHIVHRDVSPPNIMLSVEGEVKIVDFGIAKARKRVQQTSHGIIKGKFHYMAPEQAQGRDVDARTDVFSVGIVLYEMLSGHNPYDGHERQELLETVRAADIPPIRQHRSTIDPELDQIIMRALQRNPDERYQTAAEFDRALTDYRERKCEPYDRRRLSDLVREMWDAKDDDFVTADEPGGAERAAPHDETGVMTADEYEAGQSSVIYDAGKGQARNAGGGPSPGAGREQVGRSMNAEAELDPEVGDENPFDEEAPTEIWEGAQSSDDSPTRNARPPSSGESSGSEGGGQLGEDMPSPPSVPEIGGDSESDRPLPPKPDDESSEQGGGDASPVRLQTDGAKTDDASPVRSQTDGAKTDRAPAVSNVRSAASDTLEQVVDRLEQAGIDRRIQLYVGVGLGLTLMAGFGFGLIAYLTAGSSETPTKASANNPEGQKSGAAAATAGAESGPSKVSMAVASEPSTAEVSIDGDPRGTTPTTLESLNVGQSYELKVEKDGYGAKTKTITPSAHPDPVTVELDHADGVFRISTYPTDAEIELNGETVGYSPVTVTKLSRNKEHEIVARLEGESIERTVTWKEGENPVKELDLEFSGLETSDEDVEEERDRRRRERTRRRDREERQRRARRARNRDRQESEPEPSPSSGRSGGTESTESGSTDEEVTDTNLFSTGSSESSESSGSSGSSAGNETRTASTSESTGGGGSSGASSDDSEAKNLDIWGSGSGGSGNESKSGGGGQTGAKKQGYLSVQVQKGWGKVYVDGEQVASETPLVKHALEPGQHVVKVYYPVLKRYSGEKTIQVKPGKTSRAIFDP